MSPTPSPRRSLFSRLANWLLVSGAVLFVLLVLFYVEENWRGGRVWDAYATEHEKAGDPLHGIASPSVLADERNFMKTPLLERLLFADRNSPQLREFTSSLKDFAQAPAPSWTQGKRYDAAKLLAPDKDKSSAQAAGTSDSSTPAEILQRRLAACEPFLHELRSAVDARPESVVVRPEPISEDKPFDARTARFQVVRHLVLALNAHGSVALAAGQNELVCSDVLACLKICQGFSQMNDPLLVEAMISSALTKPSLQLIWEATRSHSFTDAQLARVETQLAQIRPAAGLQRGLHIERNSMLHTMDHIARSSGSGSPALDPAAEVGAFRLLAFAPKGWIGFNKYALAKDLQGVIDLLATRESPGFLPAYNRFVHAEESWVQHSAYNPYRALASMMTPAYRKVSQATLQIDACVSLARIACALERYRLANSRYPLSLAELAPAYLAKLPVDVVSGEPLHYKPDDQGSYLLYSIALNGRDDGGLPPTATADAARDDFDWAWPQFAKN